MAINDITGQHGSFQHCVPYKTYIIHIRLQGQQRIPAENQRPKQDIWVLERKCQMFIPSSMNI